MLQHPVGQYPYLICSLGGRLVHAQEIGWAEHRVMIRYPQVIDELDHFSPPIFRWVNRAETFRIRREDALWNHPDDDVDWHEIEDEAIEPRPPES